MSDPVRRIMAARLLAQKRWPYISHLLFSLKIVPASPGALDTLAVDAGWRLYFNEDFVMKLTVAELATVLQHEAMHCMLNHHERYAALRDPKPDHKLFNIAGDCSINHVIEEAGYAFAKDFPPVRYKNFPKINSSMTTERAYYTLKEEDEEPGGGGDDSAPDCGSASGGKPREYEIDTADEELPGASPELKAVVKTQVASEITKSRSQPGYVPGDLIRWADDFLSPKINWRRQLAVRVRVAMATKAGRRDYSMMRPSRREQALATSDRQIRLPAMRQPGDPKVAVVVDTSGSITNSVLQATLAEVMGITRAVGNARGLEVIACDSVAYPAVRVRSATDVRKLKLPGGGGTDMRNGIQAALETKPRPDVIVVVTDGYTPWPETKPAGCENYIVLLTEDAALRSVPDWAKTVLLELDLD
jgi:predicted metal-dependent peptidase